MKSYSILWGARNIKLLNVKADGAVHEGCIELLVCFTFLP